MQVSSKEKSEARAARDAMLARSRDETLSHLQRAAATMATGTTDVSTGESATVTTGASDVAAGESATVATGELDTSLDTTLHRVGASLDACGLVREAAVC